MDNSKNRNRKYIKICKESGCVSANYIMHDSDDDMLIVPYENNELSGSFKQSKLDRKR